MLTRNQIATCTQVFQICFSISKPNMHGEVGVWVFWGFFWRGRGSNAFVVPMEERYGHFKSITNLTITMAFSHTSNFGPLLTPCISCSLAEVLPIHEKPLQLPPSAQHGTKSTDSPKRKKILFFDRFSQRNSKPKCVEGEQTLDGTNSPLLYPLLWNQSRGIQAKLHCVTEN